MKSPGDEALAETRPAASLPADPPVEAAAPSPSDPTRTSQPDRPADSPPRVPRSPMAPQLRDHDRYDILGEHGRGGLGRVSRAHDRELGRDIAIKELISRGHLGEIRFLREALITARLEHPGIVPVYEAGRWGDGTPFYAMKLVSGRPLRELIAERKTVDDRIGLLHHVIAVADAIAYAHGKNIIHRDLKPANVIVGEFGETVVIDWGLAKDLTATEELAVGGGPFREHRDDGLTSAGTVLGTPAYMSPEQARGEPVDQRTDVFAIGAMLWELCSLQKLPPSFPGHRQRILRKSGIDPDLITIIEKASDPEQARRYPDAAALAADLKAFKAGARIAARRYSPWAVLAHWTRRHRTSTIAMIAGIVLVAAGGVAYVRSIRAERDRADLMRDRADAALALAQQDRDRAQLSAAALLNEKDPTSAKALLTSLHVRSAQYSLLLSRATHLAAAHDLRLRGNILGLHLVASGAVAGAIVNGGELVSVDLERGSFHVADRDLRGPATLNRDGTGWLYSRRRPKVRSVTIADSGDPTRTIDAGPVLADVTGQLVTAMSRTFALDNHSLYELTSAGNVLLRRDVRSVTGDAHRLLVCTTTNVLEVNHDGALERRTRCADHRSTRPLVAAGTGYAALLDADTLLVVRDGTALELPVHVAGEYALAMSPAGLLAVADFNDKTWFVRPGGIRLEVGPLHASRPMTVAAAGRYAAWGYADGTVIAIDTSTGASWEFRGHDNLVTSLAIDASHARLISTAGPNLRIWHLTTTPLTKVAELPCNAFNLARSPDGIHIAMDCADGGLRIWQPSSGTMRELHRHRNTAFGVAWYRGRACSGGFDGRVMCSSLDGKTEEVLSTPESVRWIVASPDHERLIMATADGKIWNFDGSLRTLYSHDIRPYRMAFGRGGRLLASGAADGSVIVYDYDEQRVVNTTSAHRGLVTNVVWDGEELWTASLDGSMKQWLFRDGALTMTGQVSEPAFRFFHLLKTGWTANVDGHFLLVALNEPHRELRFDMDRYVERVEVSADERYIAATMDGETVIVDLAKNAVTSLRIPSDGVGHVGFAADDTLVVSNGSGLFTASLSKLDYTSF